MIMKPEGQIVLILLLCIILNSIQFIDWWNACTFFVKYQGVDKQYRQNVTDSILVSYL
jgi:hypothetical protein